MYIYNDYKYLQDLLQLSNYIKNIFNLIIDIPIKFNKKLFIKYDDNLNKMIFQHVKYKYNKYILIEENEKFDIYISNKECIIYNKKIKLMNNHFNFFINFFIIHYIIYKYLKINNINPDIPIY